jgi:hypothetical protein
MSSGEQVRVEPSQLEGKADDISTEVNDSSGFPTAPCAFTFVQTASAQVQAGAVTREVSGVGKPRGPQPGDRAHASRPASIGHRRTHPVGAGP